MYEGWRDRAEFVLVYIREAHPTDGWQVPANERDGVKFPQPTTLEERRGVASKCVAGLKISIPCVLDGMDNKVGDAYAAWPERLFVVDAEGRIAYAGRPGPQGFDPDELQRWLERNLGPPRTGAIPTSQPAP